ncbi:MAG TPA: 16S rRNA (guanine(527)-N(7))-methyltransferase RsmG [Micromonosporaceae bacterium]|nr:16S rRNA (guanine(527)-N(7))-methyltransferase RsmG [Micromonosporaceae bacterium]
MAGSDRPDEYGNPPRELLGAAETYFGPRLPLARRYAQSLATDAVIRGLIGPREADRLWDRHVLNCVAIAPSMPTGAHVIDVGAGAGLPGVVLAIARPDLRVTLVESLARRTAYLDEIVDSLGLGDQVAVVRARAEEIAENVSMFNVKPADVVTSRAVAPLDRLATWCLPLARIGGRIVAVKGTTASEEVATHANAVARLGGSTPIVREYGTGLLPDPTTVVEVVRERVAHRSAGDPRTRGRSRRQ